jgi:hypothetical protein
LYLVNSKANQLAQGLIALIHATSMDFGTLTPKEFDARLNQQLRDERSS